eukprot:CAMPEP_0197620282 /NCGR_PEP_ID=MMETSP1338-20131121/1138_1 /TAXON_ID=43686 ORGANISM="Pelagodinium beii, Strain RCC1491" /NCGR_SAMPLE_ID=MMETSP1338 /ASSEMBLY_ACC=CAM_ASM_000754 /LENGTH=221 /DNA_ID=CAMNT_0043189423 /DNA_START=75 /DNA_END=740 /DNA_ORIENTATION=-
MPPVGSRKLRSIFLIILMIVLEVAVLVPTMTFSACAHSPFELQMQMWRFLTCAIKLLVLWLQIAVMQKYSRQKIKLWFAAHFMQWLSTLYFVIKGSNVDAGQKVAGGCDPSQIILFLNMALGLADSYLTCLLLGHLTPEQCLDVQQQFESFTMDPDTAHRLKRLEDICVICMCDFALGQQVTALPCEHVFHKECFMSYASRKSVISCPLRCPMGKAKVQVA